MIQTNLAIHTNHNGNNGVTISTGAVLNVNFTPLTRRIYDEQGSYSGVEHDIQFSSELYKSLSSYESADNVLIDVLANPIREFNVNFIARNVDIQALTSVTDLLDLYKSHIEDGDADYPGIGSGNAAIVWPS